MLELRGVHKSLGGQTHLDSISLRFEPGLFNVILGETLAGKTTLMRIMAGLEHPGEGRIHWNGADVTCKPVRERNVAMVHQQFVNYPGMSVFDNIASPLRASGRPPADLSQKVGRVAELLGMSGLLDRLPAQLSGGQQQRTAIARALVKDADLVLLDEPLANLDYKLREVLREALPELFAGSGSVIAYATTDPEEALTLGGHTAALHEGRLISFGPTGESYRQPGTLREARVFSNPPLNEITMFCSDGMLRSENGLVFTATENLAGLPENRRLTVAFRAHHLLLRKPESEDVEEFDGTIVLTEITGSESYVHLHVRGCNWVAQTPLVADLDDGSSHSLHLHRDCLMVFDGQERMLRAPVAGAGTRV